MGDKGDGFIFLVHRWGLVARHDEMQKVYEW